MVKSRSGDEQGGEADAVEEADVFYVHLTAGTGPSMALPIVRHKSNAEIVYSHAMPVRSEGTTMTYMWNDIKRITVVWDEWLDTVANNQLKQSCNFVFRGSHDWVLQALDVVCSFAGAALNLASIRRGDIISKSNTMLRCSVRLLFAIY